MFTPRYCDNSPCAEKGIQACPHYKKLPDWTVGTGKMQFCFMYGVNREWINPENVCNYCDEYFDCFPFGCLNQRGVVKELQEAVEKITTKQKQRVITYTDVIRYMQRKQLVM
jgi:hypothetical protein